MAYKKRADGRYHRKINCGYGDNGKPIRVDVYAKSGAELEDKAREIKARIKSRNDRKISRHGI
ncbi:MAG: hypothetical protein LBR68_02690 [Lachnoclostridium sp.]|jgi:hypothetical protein|nr:hypothetical protein [Lachnoclostridium sp.]